MTAEQPHPNGRGRALVVGEERELRRRLERVFRTLGFTVVSVADREEALAGERFVDLAAVDEALRDAEPAVAKRLRQVCPLVLVAVRGAIPLPQNSGWMGARGGGVDDVVEDHADARAAAVVRVGDLEIDRRKIWVRRCGQPVELSDQDLRLLFTLVDHAGQVLTRKELLHLVWGYGYLGESRMIDVAICRLRQRIEDDPACPRYIHTRRGQGYVFGLR